MGLSIKNDGQAVGWFSQKLLLKPKVLAATTCLHFDDREINRVRERGIADDDLLSLYCYNSAHSKSIGAAYRGARLCLVRHDLFRLVSGWRTTRRKYMAMKIPPVLTELPKPQKAVGYFTAHQYLALRLYGLTLGEAFFLLVLMVHHRHYEDIKLPGKERFRSNEWSCWFRSIKTSVKGWRGGDRQLSTMIKTLKANNLIVAQPIVSFMTKRGARMLTPNYKVLYDEILEGKFHLKPKKQQKTAENSDLESYYDLYLLPPSIKNLEKKKRKFLTSRDIANNLVKLGQNKNYIKTLSTNQLLYVARRFNLRLDEIGLLALMTSLHISGYALKNNKEFLGKLVNINSDTVRSRLLPKLLEHKLIIINKRTILLDTNTIHNIKAIYFTCQVKNTSQLSGVIITNQEFHISNDIATDRFSSGQFSPTTAAIGFYPTPKEFECLNQCDQTKSRQNLICGQYVNFLFEFDHDNLEEQLPIVLNLAQLGVVNRIVFSGHKSFHCRITVEGVRLFDNCNNWTGEYERVWDKLARLFGDLTCDSSFRSDPSRWTRTPGQVRTPNDNIRKNDSTLNRYHVTQDLIFLSDSCVRVNLGGNFNINHPNNTLLEEWRAGNFGENRHNKMPFFISACRYNRVSFQEVQRILEQIPADQERDNLMKYAEELYVVMCDDLM